ncbi:hypothetical protein J6Z39_09120 [bacterium]|nr:hypothetical protein [bacterium]MBP5435964.1 hypothetical protein [bacterium]
MTNLNVQSVPGDSIAGSVQVILTRLNHIETCEVGLLYIRTRNLVWNCRTLELPWKNNQPQVSCIPAGTYTCRRINSPKFGDTFEVCGVPKRSGILFHPGNSVPKDSQGCILLGLETERNSNNYTLLASRAAFKTFLKMLSGVNSFDLNIVTSEESCPH